MVRCPHRCHPALLACALFLALWPVVAHAQSAVDGFNPGANSEIWAFAVQADGKILVGGAFTMIGGGGTGSTTRHYLARLNIDGSVDPTFNPDPNSTVYSLAVQPNGQILVGGDFTTFAAGTIPRSKIARLDADGSVDGAFDPGANNTVFTMALQADGQILVGGDFTTLGGGGTGTPTRNRLGRLSSTGALDGSFDPGANERVWTLALQTDGQILVGGYFTLLGGGGTGSTPRSGIGRVSAAGVIDAGFNPSANSVVYALGVQADGKILLGGEFTSVGPVPRNHIARVTAAGALDASFDPGADGIVRSLLVQPDGSTVVAGAFSMLGGGGVGITPRNRIGRLFLDGTVDTVFNPGADTEVDVLALQLDGKLLIGGTFSMLGGAGTIGRNHIGRLYLDGSLDDTISTVLVPPAQNSEIRSVAVQSDGVIIVNGGFQPTPAWIRPDGSVKAVGAAPQGHGGVVSVGDGYALVGADANHGGVTRYGPDGSVDPTYWPGANQDVRALALQPDGRLVVGGWFTTLGGGGFYGTTIRKRIGRLNVGGSLDTSFDPGADNAVLTIALQPDGKILVGGLFTTVGGGGNGTGHSYLGRLNADGSVDQSFDPGVNDYVTALAVQPDGKILVGGNFTKLGGGGAGNVDRFHIGRLMPDGSLDMAFNPGADNFILSFGQQADGKILVGGAFTMLGGGGTGTTVRRHLGRLQPDGSLDLAFDPGSNERVEGFAQQLDGKVIVVGDFTTLGDGGFGSGRSRFGRLASTDPAREHLIVNTGGTTISWFRSGAGPELWRVSFEMSLDGTTYTTLGDGERIAEGWQLIGEQLPTNQNVFVRARGVHATGFGNGSSAMIESVRNAYITCVVIAPASLPAGMIGSPYSVEFTASGAVGAVSFAEIGLLPAGMLLNGSTLSGTPTQAGSFPLTITATDAGAGCTSSQTVTLLINGFGPNISTQPQSYTIASGESRTLTVAASGTAPFSYQWHLGTTGDTTTPVGGATASSYTTPAITSTTSYWVRVSNPYGSDDSAPATLTVSALAFTDDPLVAGTVIKVVHLTELRTRINALRAQKGLPAWSYTHPTLTAGVSPIMAVDVIELRAALHQVYNVIGATPPIYSTSPAPGTTIRVADIAEIRAALRAIE